MDGRLIEEIQSPLGKRSVEGLATHFFTDEILASRRAQNAETFPSCPLMAVRIAGGFHGPSRGSDTKPDYNRKLHFHHTTSDAPVFRIVFQLHQELPQQRCMLFGSPKPHL